MSDHLQEHEPGPIGETKTESAQNSSLESPLWRNAGLAAVQAADTLPTLGAVEEMVLSELVVEPIHAMATMVGRCMGTIAGRGSVFTDMHPGNFMFDGEYPVVSDIGHDVSVQDIVEAIKTQLVMLKPVWGPMYRPMLIGYLLQLQALLGWARPRVAVEVANALELDLILQESLAQQSRADVLERAGAAEGATPKDEEDAVTQWVGAAVALRLAGLPLLPGLLDWLADIVHSPQFERDQAAKSWVNALQAEEIKASSKTTNYGLLQIAKKFRSSQIHEDARTIDVTIVGYLHRLTSTKNLEDNMLGSAQLGHLILQKYLNDPKVAEAELNCLTHRELPATPKPTDLFVLLSYINSAAISELTAFGASLQQFVEGKVNGVLWSAAWRALAAVRAVQARVQEVFEIEDYERSLPGLVQLTMTHRRTIATIVSAIRTHMEKESWCPWLVAIQRDAPNLQTEFEWLQTGLKELEAHRPKLLKAHWNKLAESVNLQNDPMRILDNARSVFDESIPIAWKELGSRWSVEPMIVPHITQAFAWHPYEVRSGPTDS